MTTWWVNQGRTFKVELPDQYLFAPLRDKRGRQLDHWESMTQLRPGDTVIHYAKGEVRAVSRVGTVARRSQRPHPLPERWFNDGRIADVAISPATTHIERDDIPQALRLGEQNGPFTADGQVRQIYLLPLSEKFASTFFAKFGRRFGESYVSKETKPASTR